MQRTNARGEAGVESIKGMKSAFIAMSTEKCVDCWITILHNGN